MATTWTTAPGPHGPGPSACAPSPARCGRPAELIRFVVGPDGRVVPDLKRKLPGRGLWVTAARKVLATAINRSVFAKGFRKAVKEREALVDEAEGLLVRSAVEALAIAAKAGQFVSGFAKVESAVGRRGAGPAPCPTGRRRRPQSTATRRSIGAAETPDLRRQSDSSSEAELGLALGGTNVIHAAVLAGEAGKAS